MKTKLELRKLKKATELELQAMKVPWPKTLKELNKYIETLVNRKHDYGTCVYAMSMSALATYYFVSSKLGSSGFQASCADLDFLKRTRMMENGFMVLDFNNLLYPQYDLHAQLAERIEKIKPYLAKKAKELLAEKKSAHPDVIQRWKELAAWIKIQRFNNTPPNTPHGTNQTTTSPNTGEQTTPVNTTN